MLFLLISFKKIFKDEKYNLGFLFIGIAIGLKIIAVVPAIVLGLYLIYPLRKIDKLKDIFKINFYTIIGLIIAQPALLIPHPKIYSRIISANIHASRYNQEKFLSLILITYKIGLWSFHNITIYLQYFLAYCT